MTIVLFSTWLLLSAIFFRDVLSLNSLAVRDPASDRLINPGRRLSAAKRSDKLDRRDVKGCLRYDHQLHYLDGKWLTCLPYLANLFDHKADTITSDSQFAAKLAMEFKAPTLMLEDIEHHIQKVECFDSRVYLHFGSTSDLEVAHEEFRSVADFLLITSHEGCNEYGERDPHMVSEAAAHVSDRVIILKTSRVPWKHTFDSMTFDFGESEESLIPRRHGELRPRQAASSTAGGSAASTSIAYPAAPTSTATSINDTDSFSHSYVNTAILPPDQSLGQVSVHAPKLSAGINIKCKNCTFEGSINLVAGSLTMGPFNSSSNQGILNQSEALEHYVQNGYVAFTSNGFGAHVELDSSIEASAELESYTIPLPTIPITSLLIPGIASVGPQFAPQITAGFKLEANLEFTYGFEVTIPDNSSLVLDLANRNGSSYQGFDNTAVTALPFQAETANVELTVSAGFSPALLLGISFFAGEASAGAGFFLDSPTISTTLSTVSHVNSKCENVTDSAAANGAINDIFGTLTHIDASVEIGLGVIAQAEVDFAGSDSLKDVDTHTMLSKQFDLPTACISFDSNAKTYGPAPTSTSTSTSSPVAKPSKSGASSTLVPFGGWCADSRPMMVGFIVVCAYFVLL